MASKAYIIERIMIERITGIIWFQAVFVSSHARPTHHSGSASICGSVRAAWSGGRFPAPDFQCVRQVGQDHRIGRFNVATYRAESVPVS